MEQQWVSSPKVDCRQDYVDQSQLTWIRQFWESWWSKASDCLRIRWRKRQSWTWTLDLTGPNKPWYHQPIPSFFSELSVWWTTPPSSPTDNRCSTYLETRLRIVVLGANSCVTHITSWSSLVNSCSRFQSTRGNQYRVQSMDTKRWR